MHRRADDPRVVCNAATDVLPDPVCRIGGKRGPACGIEVLAGTHQSQRRELQQVLKVEPSAPRSVPFGDDDGEPQMGGAYAVSEFLEAPTFLCIAARGPLASLSHLAQKRVALVAAGNAVPETGIRGAHSEQLAVAHGVRGWPGTVPSATVITSLFPFGLHARWNLT